MRVEVRGVSKEYASAPSKVAALASVSMTADRGEFVALVGPSSCGKSTLLRLIAGTLAPDMGEIRFLGWNHPPIRRLVFQENSLFPWMSVVDNVAFGLEMARTAKLQRRAAALDLLARMGMAGFADLYPTNFPAACASARQLPARSCASRTSCSWTSRCARWTRRCS